jgi:hypothetical protein
MTTINGSLPSLTTTTYIVSVTLPLRGQTNLYDVMLPLPPGELSLGADASELEIELVRWANDITSRLQQLLQE